MISASDSLRRHRSPLRSAILFGAFIAFLCASAYALGWTSRSSAPPDSLDQLANDFWSWRARYQPFSSDDIPRMERPTGRRDWSAAAIAAQRAALVEFENRWHQLDASSGPVSRQVDYRLMGSALARVRWELDVNRRWQRDPSFYLDQSVGAVLEALLPPLPFDAARSREIVARMEQVPEILGQGKENLHSVRPFAQLAINLLANIRPQLLHVQRELTPLLAADGSSDAPDLRSRFQFSTEKAIVALESYRAWLEEQLTAMPAESSVGRANYEFFLHNVALLPYSPEQLLELSRQEWNRAVSFEQYEKQRNQGVPELKLAATQQEEIANFERGELAIRKFMEERGILSVPADIPHYTARPTPPYLGSLPDFVELDDFTGPSRLADNAVRWIDPPSPNLGFFWLATAKDVRPEIVHEGVPGHYFQMSLSWRNEDPIRRHYYDSGANEGIGFYAEEMMLQAGLFDDSPHSREIIYNFMRLRALRVEADVDLALGRFTLAQAADYLAQHVPMDKQTAGQEAAFFSTTPGQAISYQIGKIQILGLLADARLAQGDKFNLRAFHDYLWKNGNVPIALLRWEYLGDRSDLDRLAISRHRSRPR
ncbi:MAG: DUF885 family protein [Candidatus Acidiferrales bacterium]